MKRKSINVKLILLVITLVLATTRVRGLDYLDYFGFNFGPNLLFISALYLPEPTLSFSVGGYAGKELLDFLSVEAYLTLENQQFKAKTTDERTSEISSYLGTFSALAVGRLQFGSIGISLLGGPKIYKVFYSSFSLEQDTVEIREFNSQQASLNYGLIGGGGLDIHLTDNIRLNGRGYYTLALNKQITSYAYSEYSTINSFQAMLGLSYHFPKSEEELARIRNKNKLAMRFISKNIVSFSNDKDDILTIEVVNMDVKKSYSIKIVEHDTSNVIYTKKLGDFQKKATITWKGETDNKEYTIINYIYRVELYENNKIVKHVKPIFFKTAVFLPVTLRNKKLGIFGITYNLNTFKLKKESKKILKDISTLLNNRSDISEISIKLYWKNDGIEELSEIVLKKFSRQLVDYLDNILENVKINKPKISPVDKKSFIKSYVELKFN